MVTTTSIDIPINPGFEDMHRGFRDPTQRVTGANGERLGQADILIHPDAEMAPEMQALTLLLANFQEELQKKSQNPLLAGTYLGVAADLPNIEEVATQPTVSCWRPQTSACRRLGPGTPGMNISDSPFQVAVPND